MASGSFVFSTGGATQKTNPLKAPHLRNTVSRQFSIQLQGLTGSGGSVVLMRSVDNGATWVAVGAAYTADVADVGLEPTDIARYEFWLTGMSSGTINWSLE